MRLQTLVLLLTVLTAASCSRGRQSGRIVVEQPRLTSILVEVFDPNTNLAWEGVSVRVLEADQEWSGCTCVSPFQDEFLTDQFGQVLLDEFLLADQQVGFIRDQNGAAILSSDFDEDEALVVLEISAIGFQTVIVEVPVSWDEPDVFVEVPF
ncbi:MAG: hypothetical protein AB8H80_05290 [Planctomycetota bacterium]